MENRAFLVTGPIHSGKTTRLQAWAETRADVFGIFTPKQDGRRIFQNPRTGEIWEMEAGEKEETLEVGRYRFSKSGFEKTISILMEGIQAEGHRWLIVDEIGPLELRGEGFAEVLKTVLMVAGTDPSLKLLLVVREGLPEKVEAHFNLKFLPFPEPEES